MADPANISFTTIASAGRLSKQFDFETDGSVAVAGETYLVNGGFYVAACPTDAGIKAALTVIGQVFDSLDFKQAIVLGVMKNGVKQGKIVTKDAFAKGGTTAQTRSLEHLQWPDGLGLLLGDGDGVNGLPARLSELYPPMAEAAMLVRPSASASVVDPATGKALSESEHCFMVIDEPSQSRNCLNALLRLAWVKGKGKSGGRLELKNGHIMVKGPIDVGVGSPERLVYEGAAVVDQRLTTLPRQSSLAGGEGVLCAANLIAYADEHAPEETYEALIEEARNDPAFVERRRKVQIAYGVEFVEKAVKRGVPREKAAKMHAEAAKAGTRQIGPRTWLPLTPEHELYWPNGTPFTVADIQKDPKAFHRKECRDPIEGMSYKSRNCAVIYTDRAQIVIHSRAHGDAFSYVIPRDAGMPWADVFALLQSGDGKISLLDFHAYLPDHKYIFVPTGTMWGADGVNAILPPQPLLKRDGTPVRDSKGKPKYIPATTWLDKNRPAHSMSWAPGEPKLIEGRVATVSGWKPHPGAATFNLYIPPLKVQGDKTKAGRWIELVERIYPKHADHFFGFCAHCVQKPEEKINHGLILVGSPGIGKDTILQPLTVGVGPWNFRDIAPSDIVSQWTDYMHSTVLRISELRDLGDINRFKFYESTKTILAAPPDMTRINGKYIPQHYIPNVTAVTGTTNYPDDGLYLPPDDRRHYVCGSTLTKGDFGPEFWPEFWAWYAAGGINDVAAWLAEHDISKFDAKNPPEKTDAFWRLVDGGMASEVPELRDALDRISEEEVAIAAVKTTAKDCTPEQIAEIKKAAVEAAKLNGGIHPPDAVTLAMVTHAANHDLAQWLRDPKNRPTIKHRFDSCGYAPVRLPGGAKDGMWVVDGKRVVIYARNELPSGAQIRAAEKLKADQEARTLAAAAAFAAMRKDRE